MENNLRLTMYVAVAKHKLSRFTNLTLLAQQLSLHRGKTVEGFRFAAISPRRKGKLQDEASLSDAGSLHISLTYKRHTKCSVLIFKKSMKISGGVPEYAQDELHEDIAHVNNDVLMTYVKSVANLLSVLSSGIFEIENGVRFVNINATQKGTTIPNFMEFCSTKVENNKDICNTCFLPLMFETGAISACHVYPFRGSNMSAKIHPSGSVQYMGFKEIDMIHVYSQMINDVIKS